MADHSLRMNNYTRLTDPLVAMGSALLVTFVVCRLSTTKNHAPNAWHALVGAVLSTLLLVPINFGAKLFENDFWADPKARGLVMVPLFIVLTFCLGSVAAACVVSLYRRRSKQ